MKLVRLLIVSVTCVAHPSVCSADEPAPTTAEEVIRRWEKAAMTTATCAYEHERHIELPRIEEQRKDYSLRVAQIYREDGGRFKKVETQWSQQPSPDFDRDPKKAWTHEVLLDPRHPRYKATVLSTSRTDGRERLSAEVHRSLRLFEHYAHAHDGPLDGFVHTGGLRTPTLLLEEQAPLNLRAQPEAVDGRKCFVVEARSKYGRLTLWVDPQRDYQLARARVEKARGDWWIENEPFPQSIPIRDEDGVNHHRAVGAVITVEDVRFTQVADRWVTSAATVTEEYELDDGVTVRYIAKHERRNIDLAPRFEQIRVFELEIPEGTPVAFEGSFPVQFKWRNGKPEPVDKAGI